MNQLDLKKIKIIKWSTIFLLFLTKCRYDVASFKPTDWSIFDMNDNNKNKVQHPPLAFRFLDKSHKPREASGRAPVESTESSVKEVQLIFRKLSIKPEQLQTPEQEHKDSILEETPPSPTPNFGTEDDCKPIILKASDENKEPDTADPHQKSEASKPKRKKRNATFLSHDKRIAAHCAEKEIREYSKKKLIEPEEDSVSNDPEYDENSYPYNLFRT